MSLPRLSIRTRVVLLAVIAVLPLLLLVIYEAELDRRKALGHARGDALSLARAQAANYAAVVTGARYLLSGLAAGRMGAAGGDRDCAARLRRIVDAHSVHVNAAIADLSGDVRCSARELGKPVNVADRDYFHLAIERRTFVVSGPVVGRVSGATVVVAAQPLLDVEQRLQGVIVVALDVRALAATLHASIPTGAVVLFADPDGTAVARWPDVAEYRGRVLPELAASKATIAATGEGFIDLVGLDGVARVAAYARPANALQLPLYIVAGIPREDIERGPRMELLRDLGVIALVLAMAFVFSSIGAQRLLVAPLRRLGQFAERYEQGDLSARSGVDHQAGEIGELARRFDQLAAHNQRVTRALKALSAGNRTLLREKSEERLLAAMCRVAVEHAGYRVAFVNYAERDERKSVRTVARAGGDDGFIDLLELTWAEASAAGAASARRSAPARPTSCAAWRATRASRRGARPPWRAASARSPRSRCRWTGPLWECLP